MELGRKIEALEKPKAKERQGARTDLPGGKLPPGSDGKTRDKVGQALGVSGKTYEKAKQVVEAPAAKPPENYRRLRRATPATRWVRRWASRAAAG